MEMQTGTTQVPAAGPAPGIYTLPLGLASAMENGDPFATCFLDGTLHALLVTIVVGLVSWVMENGEGCVVPAARDAGRAPCLFANWGKDNGQWSQWMEQRFLGRCTVSFEGRSWL